MILRLRNLAWCIAVIWLSLVPLAQAQGVNFEAFDRFASSVETNIAEGEMSDAGFNSLRESLVRWRQNFLEAQSVNSVQIEALEAQLDALGPAPAEGETEAADVAQRREQLNEALTVARTPQLEAVEAFARADTLIGRIDTTLRDRQTDALLEMQRTPLDPLTWPAAAAAVIGVLESVRSEVADTISAGDRAGQLQRLAIAGLLLIAATFVIFRGPTWIERILSRIENRGGNHAPVVYGFMVSFAGVLAAMVGISLINAALISTGILGETGRALAIGINAAILAYAIARWLGGRIFPEREAIPTPLNLSTEARASGRRNVNLLGALTGLMSLLELVQQQVKFEAPSLGVVVFPVFVLLGLTLFRTGQLIWRGGRFDEGTGTSFSGGVAQLLGRLVQLVALAAPILAAVGFVNLARGALFPLVLSLGLIAFLLALHYTIRAGYALLRGLEDDAAEQALAPVLISLIITIASLPIFALIWGARNSDLGEVWTAFRTGFRLGETTISPGVLLTFAIVFGIGYALTRLVQGTLRSSVLPRTKLDKGGQNAIVSGLGYVGITLAAVFGITSAGIDLSSFAIIIGALGVGIGFGLQNIVNNFVSGIILLIERPISEGDWVEVGGKLGVVKSISVRSTRIEMFDRTDVIVPNGDLISGTVTNWTHGNSAGRVILNVGVAYGTDTRKVETILREIAENHPLVAVNPPPTIVFQGFGADSMDFEIRIILNDIAFGLSVRTDINHEIVRRFAEEGIEIPFAQRDLWIRNPEALRQKPNSEPRPPSGPTDPTMLELGDDGDLS
jgi:small-conductance mechanosensitive channel